MRAELESGLRAVAASAGTLSELLATTPAQGADRPGEGEERWTRLRGVLSDYGPQAVADFCAAHAVRIEDLPRLLQPRPPGLAPLPAWAERLGELLRPIERPAAPDTTHPFGELLLPLQGRVEAMLARRLGSEAAWLPGEGWHELADALRARWERDFAPALFACFEVERSLLGPQPGPAGDGVYRRFVERLAQNGLSEVARAFPAAARLWAEQTEQWLDAMAELARHFLADRAELQRALRLRDVSVRRIVWPLSDFHGGGRAVARLEFGTGASVYYKPGDRSLDLAFDRLFRSWLVRRRPSQAPALRGLIRPDRSWFEALPTGLPGDRREAREVARDLGRLGTLGLVLGTTDLHPGNVLPGPAWVSVCDAETVLHPEEPEFPWRAPFLEAGWRDLDHPFRTFLASFAVAGRPEIHLRSCLGHWSSEPAKVRSPIWRDLGADTLSLAHEFGHWPNAFAPAYQALRQRLGRHWAGAVLAGAGEAWSRLRRAGPATARAIGQFGALPRRILRRNTVTYAWMLAESRRPALWVDGFERSLFFEQLGAWSGDGRALEPWERAALARGDVPRLEVRALSTEALARLLDPARPIFDAAASSRARRALQRALAPDTDPIMEALDGRGSA